MDIPMNMENTSYFCKTCTSKVEISSRHINTKLLAAMTDMAVP